MRPARHAEPERLASADLLHDIRRLINILLIRPTRSIACRCTGQPGDAATKPEPEPDEPATPAASPSNVNHDHEWRLPY
jgi:hypothetical protein